MKTGKESIIIILLNTLIILFGCNEGKQHLSGNKSNQRNEFLVRFNQTNGSHDTTLNSIIKLDSAGNTIEEKKYIKGILVTTIKYLTRDTFSNLSKKNDSIVYVLTDRNQSKEFRYYNGLLIEKKYFDTNKNVIRDVSFRIDSTNQSDSINRLYTYIYGKEKTILFQNYVVDNDTINIVRNTFDGQNKIITQDYIFNKCCENQQPIPNDKIIYSYNVDGTLQEKVEIIDRTVKRRYKDQNDGYFNVATITKFKYNEKRDIVEIIEYKSNYSSDPNVPLDSLLNPKSIEAHFIYTYADL